MHGTHTKPTGLRLPTTAVDAEKSWITGVIDLLCYDSEKAGQKVAAVPPGWIADDRVRDVRNATQAALAECEAPNPADVKRHLAQGGGLSGEAAITLWADVLAKVQGDDRGAYALNADRYANDIRESHERRQLAVARDRVSYLVGEAVDGGDRSEAMQAVAALQSLLECQTSGDDADETAAWVPFPVELLPGVLSDFVSDAAASIGGDPAMLAMPVLSSAAAAIGDTFSIELKRGWTEPAILWSMVIGESGSAKTPSFKAAISFANDIDSENKPLNDQTRREYAAEMKRFKAESAAWMAAVKKSREAAGDPPDEPERPRERAYVVSDATIEALVHKLADNPRGLLLARDELSGWLSSFDRYAGSSGGVSSDAAQWLELHNAGRIVVDRRHSGRLEVPRAAVSIAGGIQPATLVKALGNQHVDNGLLARFLMAMPPAAHTQWSEAEASIFVTQSMRDMLTALYAIPHAGRPNVCSLTPEAKDEWVEFYNEHQEAKHAAAGPVKSMLAKTEASAARLALVCSLVDHASRGAVQKDEITLEDIRRGIGLARWFANEWQRVFGLLVGRQEKAGDEGTLVEWIVKQGGDVPVRTIYSSGPRRYRGKAKHVERLVGELVRGGKLASYSKASNDGGPPAYWVKLPS